MLSQGFRSLTQKALAGTAKKQPTVEDGNNNHHDDDYDDNNEEKEEDEEVGLSYVQLVQALSNKEVYPWRVIYSQELDRPFFYHIVEKIGQFQLPETLKALLYQDFPVYKQEENYSNNSSSNSNNNTDDIEIIEETQNAIKGTIEVEEERKEEAEQEQEPQSDSLEDPFHLVVIDDFRPPVVIHNHLHHTPVSNKSNQKNHPKKTHRSTPYYPSDNSNTHTTTTIDIITNNTASTQLDPTFTPAPAILTATPLTAPTHHTKKWSCPACTLVNPHTKSKCNACETINPEYVPPPEITSARSSRRQYRGTPFNYNESALFNAAFSAASQTSSSSSSKPPSSSSSASTSVSVSAAASLSHSKTRKKPKA